MNLMTIDYTGLSAWGTFGSGVAAFLGVIVAAIVPITIFFLSRKRDETPPPPTPPHRTRKTETTVTEKFAPDGSRTLTTKRTTVETIDSLLDALLNGRALRPVARLCQIDSRALAPVARTERRMPVTPNLSRVIDNVVGTGRKLDNDIAPNSFFTSDGVMVVDDKVLTRLPRGRISVVVPRWLGHVCLVFSRLRAAGIGSVSRPVETGGNIRHALDAAIIDARLPIAAQIIPAHDDGGEIAAFHVGTTGNIVVSSCSVGRRVAAMLDVENAVVSVILIVGAIIKGVNVLPLMGLCAIKRLAESVSLAIAQHNAALQFSRARALV